MENVNVNLRKITDNSYKIVIDKNLLKMIPKELKKKPLGNRYLIITDTIVEKLFGENLLKELRKQGIEAYLVSFRAGESSKNLTVFSRLIQKTQEMGLDRKSAVIALGGGVAGDMAGFVAAAYMRGISYIHIPTTLLAMVDSSIGGKVAVDIPGGKNIAGNFHQPKKVYIDVSLLKNLPKKEMINGLSEVVKHALIRDKKLFDFIEKNLDKILNKNEAVLIQLIKKNCEIKADIVMKDEREAGLRKLVNYGHTIGHAIETLTNYKKCSHGGAIAIGMVKAGLISNKMGILSRKELIKQNNLLKKIGLPYKMPKIDISKIIKQMKKDKKTVNKKIEFVLLEKIGKARYGVYVSDKIIMDSFGN